MIDLHTHSTASDGSLTPAELVRKAKEIGLYAVALTDHDVVDGIREFQEEAAKDNSIVAIAGSELGAAYPAVEVEIIALDIKDLEPYFERQKKLLEIRADVNRKRIKLLNNAGIAVAWEDVAFEKSGQPRKLIGKPHLCDAILKKGYDGSKEDVFKKLLGKGGLAYVEKPDPLLKDTINFIRETGAVPVLAHPVLTGLQGRRLFDFIAAAKKEGLAGIEVFHSRHSRENRLEYLEMARDLRLVVSGGSDFHGDGHADIKLGRGVIDGHGRGNVNIPDMLLAAILDRTTPAAGYYEAIAGII